MDNKAAIPWVCFALAVCSKEGANGGKRMDSIEAASREDEGVEEDPCQQLSGLMLAADMARARCLEVGEEPLRRLGRSLTARAYPPARAEVREAMEMAQVLLQGEPPLPREGRHGGRPGRRSCGVRVSSSSQPSLAADPRGFMAAVRDFRPTLRWPGQRKRIEKLMSEIRAVYLEVDEEERLTPGPSTSPKVLSMSASCPLLSTHTTITTPPIGSPMGSRKMHGTRATGKGRFQSMTLSGLDGIRGVALGHATRSSSMISLAAKPRKRVRRRLSSTAVYGASATAGVVFDWTCATVRVLAALCELGDGPHSAPQRDLIDTWHRVSPGSAHVAAAAAGGGAAGVAQRQDCEVRWALREPSPPLPHRVLSSFLRRQLWRLVAAALREAEQHESAEQGPRGGGACTGARLPVVLVPIAKASNNLESFAMHLNKRHGQ